MPAKQERGGRAANWRGSRSPRRSRPPLVRDVPLLGGYVEGLKQQESGPADGLRRPLRRPAALHIRISEPKALPELLAALHERPRYVVLQIAPDAVAVSVLGSYADGGENDLKLFLTEWRSRREGVEAEVVLDDLRAATVLPSPLR